MTCRYADSLALTADDAMKPLLRQLIALGAVGLVCGGASRALAQHHDLRVAPFDHRFDAAAAAYGVSAALLRAIAETESKFRVDAVNAISGARGLMQFLPETARRYSVDTRDATSSIYGAAEYLRDLLVEYGGNLEAALNVYGGDLTHGIYAGRVIRRAARYIDGTVGEDPRCLTGHGHLAAAMRSGVPLSVKALP